MDGSNPDLTQSIRRARDSEQMLAEPKNRRLTLDCSGRIENGIPSLLGMPLSSKLPEPAGETFDPDKIKNLESGTVDLFSELFGIVEVCRRKPMLAIMRIAVLTFGQISLNDSAEVRIKQKSPRQAIEEGGEPAYRSNCYDTRRADHAS